MSDFRTMALTRQEPVPHEQIQDVTAIVHAAVKSRSEQGRLVALAEVWRMMVIATARRQKHGRS